MSSSLVLMLALLLINSFAAAAEDSGTLVRRVCNEAEIPDYCLKALRSDPRTNKATNLKDLAQISVDLTFTNAKGSVPKIQSLIKQTSNADLKARLELCLDHYRENVYDLKNAEDYLKSGNYKEVNIASWGTYYNAEDCENSFKEPPSFRFSPLSVENRNMELLSDIITTVTRMILSN